MKLTFYYIFLSFVLCISCNQLSEEEQQFDILMQKVIDVHDQVMPKMSEISTLIKQLEPKIDTTSLGKSHGQAQQDLKNSYDFMMDWMADFSEKFPQNEEKMDTEKVLSQLKMLKEEEIEVGKLRDQINSSIQRAKELLAQ